MKKQPWLLCALILLASIASGCLEAQVRKKTLDLATTTSDLFYIQVLDNLALIIDTPDAMPYFDTPAAGTVSLQQQISAQVTPEWGAAMMGAGAFVFQNVIPQVAGSQFCQDSWQISPLADPDRLFLMHCAYRTVIGNQSPECNMVLSEYYQARDAWVELTILQNAYSLRSSQLLEQMSARVDQLAQMAPTTAVPKEDIELKRLKAVYNLLTDQSKLASGYSGGASPSGGGGGAPSGGASAAGKPPLPVHIPYRTFLTQGWFGVGTKKQVPKDACYVGHHCNTYVWVDREHMDGLVKFTLAIIDFYNLNNTGGSLPPAPPVSIH
jgi:hypothetical protein